MTVRLALTSSRNSLPASVRVSRRVLRWKSLTPSRVSSLATLLPTAAGVRLRCRAASAKLPPSALRTKHSILPKLSISPHSKLLVYTDYSNQGLPTALGEVDTRLHQQGIPP